MSFKQSAFLHNPVVLYLVGLVAVGNLLMFVYAQQFMCIGAFILSVLFASFFTKNMIARLVVAIVICNIVCVSSFESHAEGFKAKKKGKSAAKAMNPKNILKAITSINLMGKDMRAIKNQLNPWLKANKIEPAGEKAVAKSETEPSSKPVPPTNTGLSDWD